MKFSKLLHFLVLAQFTGVLLFSRMGADAAESSAVRLAIVPFSAPPGNDALQQIAARTPDLLMVELSHDNRFQLVERDKINAIWSELHLAGAGLTSADTVGKLGRILSCDWLVSGSIVQTETGTQVWVKVIDTQNSVVLDLQAVPYNPASFSETVSNIAAFLAQVSPYASSHQFVSLENFVDMSASSTREDWSQRLSALVEKHFLAAGFGVVERETISPIFSEYQLQAAGMTGDSTNRVKLKPAFWIVNGTCKWVYDTQEKLSVALRIRRVDGTAQIFRFTKLPGDELDEAVAEVIQSALTNASPITWEQAEKAEANIRTAHIQELAIGHGDLPMSSHYDTNTISITATDAYGGKRQMKMDPAWQARMENHKRDMFNSLEQAILLNPNDMLSKLMLGKALFQNNDSAESKHGEDLLEEVAASGDVTNALKAKKWLDDFRTGRLAFQRNPAGQLQIVIHGQPSSIPAAALSRPAANDFAARIAKMNEITNIATRAQTVAQIPSYLLAIRQFDGISVARLWRRNVLIACGTTLKAYDLDSEDTEDVNLPLKLKYPITAIEADDANLWLGTGGGGLIRVSLTDGTAREFGEKDGFPISSITSLGLTQGRLLIGFGGDSGYLDTATEKYTDSISEVGAYESSPEAVSNASEISTGSFTNADNGTNPLNSRYLAKLVPMRCVAICKLPGTQWTCVNISTNFNENSADSIAIDPVNPDFLWIGGSQGKVTLLNMASSKIIAQGNLTSPGIVQWIFATPDKVIIIAGGGYSRSYNLHCLEKSTLFATKPEPIQLEGGINSVLNNVLRHQLFDTAPTTSVIANNPPASAEQLRSELESALKEKDRNAIMSLIDWQDVSDDVKSLVNDHLEDMLNHEIASVKLVPLPALWTLTNEVNGIRIRPNIPVLGIVDVEYTGQSGGTSLPYGKTGDEFYISANIKEPVIK